jgi:hypothetical protein
LQQALTRQLQLQQQQPLSLDQSIATHVYAMSRQGGTLADIFANAPSRQTLTYQRTRENDASSQFLPQALPMIQNHRFAAEFTANVPLNPLPFVPQRLEDSQRLPMFQHVSVSPYQHQQQWRLNQSQQTGPETTLRIINVIGSTVRQGQKYMDVAHIPGLELICSDGSEELVGAVSFNRSSAKTFPEKLHVLLTLAETDNNLHSIISFSPHGRAFLVHNIKRFCDETAPLHFQRLGQWKSFTRQLNLYGFIRIPHGPDAGAYYHPL